MMVFALRCVESAREEGVVLAWHERAPISGSCSEEICFFFLIFLILVWNKTNRFRGVFVLVLYYKGNFKRLTRDMILVQ